MSEGFTTSFLTYYIRSLGERTRAEKRGTKYGFDWIIYNLALTDDLIPYRLPFFRAGPTEISKTKTEAEFGIDLSFITRDGTALTIFVLKDEELSNKTWTQNDFDSDLRRASAPNLSPPEFKEVRSVRIVLAYNKDEDQTGIQLYENLINSMGTKIGEDVALSFDRWNLSVLTDKVRQSLLTPSLLPQRFFSLFAYICSQFTEFRHGSDEWTNQLVPNWQRFVGDLLNEQADERAVRLLPVSLLILRQYGSGNPTAETGWLDLAEWGMLAAWRVHQRAVKAELKDAVFQIWVGFYLAELERYYAAHQEEFATEHSLQLVRTGGYIDSIAASLTAFWHIARLGILAVTFAEVLPRETEEERRRRSEAMLRASNWLIGLINANPAAQRPLIDLHHIELYLIWRTLWQLGRFEDIEKWLHGLQNNLFVRRASAVPLPFLECSNSIELVFEHVATGERPVDFCDQSSLLLLCVLELSFSLPTPIRNEVIARFYQQLVLGRTGDGEQLKNTEPLDLVGWIPPGDWGDRVLEKSLADEGESQTLQLFDAGRDRDGAFVAARLAEYVEQSRRAQKTTFPAGLPVAAIALACLKWRSPLPPEIWRLSVFGQLAG